MAGFVLVRLKRNQKKKEEKNWNKDQLFSVNHFVQWNPELNSDEMNVLINCQSGADTRLIESVSSSANNFQCLEPYADFHLWPTTPHATSELLTINQSDDAAIHHLSLLVLFSFGYSVRRGHGNVRRPLGSAKARRIDVAARTRTSLCLS